MGRLGLLVVFTWIWGGQAWSPGYIHLDLAPLLAHSTPPCRKEPRRTEDGVLLRAQLWGRLLCPSDPSSLSCCLFYLPKPNKFLSIFLISYQIESFVFTCGLVNFQECFRPKLSRVPGPRLGSAQG